LKPSEAARAINAVSNGDGKHPRVQEDKDEVNQHTFRKLSVQGFQELKFRLEILPFVLLLPQFLFHLLHRLYVCIRMGVTTSTQVQQTGLRWNIRQF
jgi:hypothetical protein